jgi:hypothetical protein
VKGVHRYKVKIKVGSYLYEMDSAKIQWCKKYLKRTRFRIGTFLVWRSEGTTTGFGTLQNDMSGSVENIIVIYLNRIGSEFLPANFPLSYFVRQIIDSAHLFPPIRVYQCLPYIYHCAAHYSSVSFWT